MMRGYAARYLPWQVRDWHGPKVLGAWVIAAAICLPLRAGLNRSAPSDVQLLELARQLHRQLAFIYVLLLYGGIIANDRAQGFYRFYLAKPVSPLWFYGQAAALSLLGVLAGSAGFVAIFSLAVRPVWSWVFLSDGLAMGLLVGAIILAFSTISKLDWMWMIVVLLVSTVLRGRFPAEASRVGSVLHAVLPPNHLLGSQSLSRLDAAGWTWLCGWALGLAMLTLVMLRRRPLGED